MGLLRGGRGGSTGSGGAPGGGGGSFPLPLQRNDPCEAGGFVRFDGYFIGRVVSATGYPVGFDPPRVVGALEVPVLDGGDPRSVTVDIRDPALALSLVSRHQKLYPGGALAQEREVLALEALSALGQLDAARSRAAAFEKLAPGSPYAVRVARAIKKTSPPAQ